MPKMIKLTNASLDGDPGLWVNPDHILTMFCYDEGGALGLLLHSGPLYVRETPEEILALIEGDGEPDGDEIERRKQVLKSATDEAVVAAFLALKRTDGSARTLKDAGWVSHNILDILGLESLLLAPPE